MAARAQLDTFMSPIPPAERALRLFDWVIAWTESPDFRGCPILHVGSEITDPSSPRAHRGRGPTHLVVRADGDVGQGRRCG